MRTDIVVVGIEQGSNVSAKAHQIVKQSATLRHFPYLQLVTEGAKIMDLTMKDQCRANHECFLEKPILMHVNQWMMRILHIHADHKCVLAVKGSTRGARSRGRNGLWGRWVANWGVQKGGFIFG